MRRAPPACPEPGLARYVNERWGAHRRWWWWWDPGHNNRCVYTSDEAVRLLFPGM